MSDASSWLPRRSVAGRLFLVVVALSCISTSTVLASDDESSVGVALLCNPEYSMDGKPVPIGAHQINDGYCDCPWTAEDEPNTMACSGFAAWPGTTLLQPVFQKQSITFQCPQQSNLKLSLSKLNDGICDCCDGADETGNDGTDCPDICEELLREERQAKAELKTKFEKGYSIRQEALQEFIQFKETVKSDIQTSQQTLEQTKQKLTSQKETMNAAKVEFVQQYLNEVEQNYQKTTFWKDLLEPLQIEELKWFQILACQIAGEMETSTKSDNLYSCAPLRVAAMEFAYEWEKDTYKFKPVLPSNDDEENKTDAIVKFADITLHNLHNSNIENKVWTSKQLAQQKLKQPKHRHNHRRLTEEEDFDDYDDDDERYYEGDDYDDYDDEYNRAPVKANDKDEDEADADRERMMSLINSSSFSTTRVEFVKQADVILEKIDEFNKQEKERKKKEKEAKDASKEETADATAEEDEATPPLNFDPMALPMIRNKLEKRKSQIERGRNFAVSAMVLVNSVLDSFGDAADEADVKHMLSKLVAGTLNYGNLSSLHIWQIFLNVIPELKLKAPMKGYSKDEQTCESPWADLCPPFETKRAVNGRSMVIPPAEITSFIQAFCTQKLSEPLQPGVCSNVPPPGDNEGEEGVIPEFPADIPDGYSGYTIVQARAEDDILHSISSTQSAASLDSETFDKIRNLEDEVESLEKEKKDAEKKISDLEKDLGGDDDKYGLDGELHSIRDDCFSIEAGKYVYEVCMFKSAKQRDVGQKAGGTDLGKWAEATVDSETGERIWKWDNGAKCWNGPKRSATVHVACGAESVLLSAEEPDTCRYVFDMESPIACDDTFRNHNGL